MIGLILVDISCIVIKLIKTYHLYCKKARRNTVVVYENERGRGITPPNKSRDMPWHVPTEAYKLMPVSGKLLLLYS